MKKLPLQLMIVAAACALLTPSAHAGKPKIKPVEQMHYRPDKISSVTGNSLTVVHIQQKLNRDYKIDEITKTAVYTLTPSTSIEVNGKRANAAALQVGMAVQVSANGPQPAEGGPAPAASTVTAHELSEAEMKREKK